MVGLFAQIEAFLLTFLLGMIAGLIFHYYQSTIHNLRIGRYILYLMDFILWIIMIIVIAAALFLINQGEIRVYVFIALVAGGAVYYKCLAQYMQRPILSLGRATVFMFQAIFSGLAKPIVFAGTWLRAQWQKCKRPPPIDDDTSDD
ncbi:MAG: spore cortex biosynthesis protein YabQ [Syntrophomonas sp.]|nr:spore cortex biosynthesis protein YabQ [Syntrophomonas sp.]